MSLEPVFLDRDGVLNENVPDYVRTLEQWVPIAGALEAAAALCAAGHPVVVVSNQSAIGRGLVPVETVELVNATLAARIESFGGRLAGIYYCPHRPDEGCPCRKPATGLVDAARAELGLPGGGWLVGDAQSDIQMGLSAGLRTILVLTGRGRAQLDLMVRGGMPMPEAVADDLGEASRMILGARAAGSAY
jgi:D-glycero-D-manno-heptose 1,7-bisphosphate phosphatase